MSFVLFDHDGHSATIPEDCKTDDIKFALDKVMRQTDHPLSQDVRTMIFRQSMMSLPKRQGADIQCIIDYAIEFNIPLRGVHLTVFTIEALATYARYFNGNHLTAREKRIEVMWSSVLLPRLDDRQFILVVKMMVQAMATYPYDAHLPMISPDQLIRVFKMYPCEDVSVVDQTLEPMDVDYKQHLWPLVIASIHNPDGRVFEYVRDKYLATRLIELKDITIDQNVNLQSLCKMIAFNTNTQHCAGDRSCKLTFSFTCWDEIVKSLALIGSLKDPNIVSALIRDDRCDEDQSWITKSRQCMDDTIVCLKCKLPNVLVDMVLQYLV